MKEVEKEKTVPVYAEINFPPQPPSQPDSPEPRYANIKENSIREMGLVIFFKSEVDFVI